VQVHWRLGGSNDDRDNHDDTLTQDDDKHSLLRYRVLPTF
jgi:hypothetical protein